MLQELEPSFLQTLPPPTLENLQTLEGLQANSEQDLPASSFKDQGWGFCKIGVIKLSKSFSFLTERTVFEHEWVLFAKNTSSVWHKWISDEFLLTRQFLVKIFTFTVILIQETGIRLFLTCKAKTVFKCWLTLYSFFKIILFSSSKKIIKTNCYDVQKSLQEPYITKFYLIFVWWTIGYKPGARWPPPRPLLSTTTRRSTTTCGQSTMNRR